MRFLITGDSWSQGEWDTTPTGYRTTHTGVQQYLIDDGHEVLNVGRGGYNNLESFAAVSDLQFDHVIFFYTDPLRQAQEHEIAYKLPFDIITAHNIDLCDNFEKLKQKTNCKITVIGGCAKFTAVTQTVDFLVPSISELLVANFHDSEFMTSGEWEQHFFKHESKFDVEQKTQWLTVMTKAGEKYSVWNQHKKYFWPDGLHVNRHGALILYQHLQKLWINE
jgi:hypothetical protein